jgi:uncharacterized membrane protein
MAVLSRALVIAAFAWSLLLGSAWWAVRDAAQAPVWARTVYAAAGLVCHQRADRSFSTDHVQWPVCGRCSGLYLAAPFGALLALLPRRIHLSPRALFAIASTPTALTLVLEWTHLAPMSNVSRAVAALPLGAAIAWILVRVADGSIETNRVH